MDEKGEYDPRFFDYQTYMTLKISPKWTASVLGNVSINNYKFIPHDRSTNFGTSTDAKQFKVYFDGQEKDRFETFFGAGNITFKPSKKAEYTLLASGYLTNELVAYDISGEYWLDQAGTGGSDSDGSVGGELGIGRYFEHSRNRLKASVFSLSLRGANGIAGHNIAYGITYNHEKSTTAHANGNDVIQPDTPYPLTPMLFAWSTTCNQPRISPATVCLLMSKTLGASIRP